MRDSLIALCCAAAVFLGVVACFLPASPAPVPAPYCDEVQPVVMTAAADAKPEKTCSPACKTKEVCVDGTCCQPAAAPHSPSSSTAIAIVDPPIRNTFGGAPAAAGGGSSAISRRICASN